MRKSAVFLPIVLAFGTIIFAPIAGVRADEREEGPFEIEKCQTISQPGSYRLISNLTALAGADCLVITASFVTIDLAGFTISGTFGNPSSLTAIVASPPPQTTLAGIAVRNGSISADNIVFVSGGVDLSSAGGSIVEGLRVSGPGAGLAIAANGIVRGNTVFGWGLSPAARFAISATGTVTGNNVSDSRGGMTIGQGSTVIDNTVFGNRNFGLVVSCPSNVTNNTAVGNGLGNLVLEGTGCNNTNNVAP